MFWVLIFIGLALVSTFVVGRLEQRIVRKVVVRSVAKLGVRTKSIDVRIGWAWPLYKTMSISVVVLDPVDADRMNAVVENVLLWLDDRWD